MEKEKGLFAPADENPWHAIIPRGVGAAADVFVINGNRISNLLLELPITEFGHQPKGDAAFDEGVAAVIQER